MSKRRLLLVLFAAVACAVLLVIGVTTAYFTEVEVKDNYITIGNVSIELDEGAFSPTEPHIVVPGSVVEKSPKLINSGNKDEFVFMKVTVPKGSVTLLSESGSDRGRPKSNLNGGQQLFRLSAEATTPDTVQSVPQVSDKDIEFTYHSGSAEGNTVDGWLLLETKTDNSGYDEYIFGYNKKLEPNDETVTLFDEVQLKSFVDREKTGETEIGIICCGIQAEYLKSEIAVNLTAEHQSLSELQAVYRIVKNKANV